MSKGFPVRESNVRRREIVDALQAHFRLRFTVLELAASDELTDCEFMGSRAVNAILDELNDSTESSVIHEENGEIIIALAWSDGFDTWLAHASTATADVSLVQLLVDSWFRERGGESQIEELQSRNSQLTHRLSRNFEELSFSRQISAALSACDASQDMLCLAEMIVPDLCWTIRAEAVALICPTEQDRTQNSVTFRYGESNVSDAAFLRCVDQSGSDSLFEPLFLNDRMEAGESSANIRSAMIVCVRKGEDIAGWLVAINPVNRTGVLTGCSESEDEFGSFESGLMESAATFLSSQAGNAQLVQELETLIESVVRVLVSTIEAKDPYTRGHSERVAKYARIIARAMNASDEEADHAHFTGLLHDIGKIGIPDAILQKVGRLDEQEFEKIKSHPTVGWEIVKGIDSLSYVKPGVLHHHERFDGGGYPAGLAGDDIPLMGRIIAVADAFDAMTSDRSYRDGIPLENVLAIMDSGAGSQWDPELIDAMQRSMPEILKVANLAETHAPVG